MTQNLRIWSRLLKFWAVALVVLVPFAMTACGGDDGGSTGGGGSTGTGGTAGSGGTATGGSGGTGTGGTTNTGGTGGTTPEQTAATPQFSIPGGTYTGAQSVQISTSTPGATIYYTVDGNDPTDASPVYAGAIDLAEGTTTTIKAFAKADGFLDSAINSATYTIEQGQVPDAAAPTFAPPGGTYTTAQDVTISTTTPNAEIHYSLDGNDPNAGSPLYTDALTISTNTTVKAIAIADGFNDSPVSTATYTFPSKAATPVFSLPAGTYTGTQTVAITTTTANATIYYTTDGSDPDGTSNAYTAPLSVATTTTVRAIAIATGFLDSDIAEAVYTIETPNPPAATPTFSPSGGTYTSPQTVTISSTTPSAEIRYTMDGTDPTPSSTLYTGPVNVDNSLVLKAYATAPNYDPSQIAEAVYTIDITEQAAAPTITPNGGNYTAPVQVTLATTEPNGVIIYTTNGTLPDVGNGTVYSGPFTLSQTTTVNAVTTAAGKLNSNPATATFTVTIDPGQVEPVTISPGTTTSNNDIPVSLTTNTSGATICYTTDGSDPTCNGSGGCQTGQTYGGVPVVIDMTNTTLNAIACLDGMNPSGTSDATYTLNTDDVLFQPAAGTIAYGTTVTMTTATNGATIRYRTDGVDPTCTTGQIFSVGVAVSANTEFRAVACKANYGPTPLTVQNATYSVALLQVANTHDTSTVNNAVNDSQFHVVYPGGFTVPADLKLCYTIDDADPTCAANGACGAGTTAITGKTNDAFLGVVFTMLPSVDAAAGGNSTRTIRATTCAANYTAAPVDTVVYTYQAADPTYARASGTTTLAGEGAANSISTTTAGASIRYYEMASGGTAPTLDCTSACTGNPGDLDVCIEDTTPPPSIPTDGDTTYGAIACATDYLASNIATASYPLPNQTAAPTFSTQGTTLFHNDIAANSITMDSTSIANDGTATADGIICWTTADTGTIDCNESATNPTCVYSGFPHGQYSYDTTTTLSNVPPSAIQDKGKQLRAIACGNGLGKSAITTQIFDFQVGAVSINPPSSATADTIGIGEILDFDTITQGAIFRYTVGTSAAPPADPNCTSVGTVGNFYQVTNGDRLNGSLIVKVIGCRNGYDPSGVTTSNTYTHFRGAAMTFSIAAGTYGDTLDTGSTNSPSGRVAVQIPAGAGITPTRLCVTVNGTTPTCAADGSACTGSATDYISNQANNLLGYQPGELIDWADIDGSNGFTLRGLACYDTTNVANPPVTVEGPYNFAIAPLAVANTTPDPNPTPFAKTQRLEYTVGTNNPDVAAPGNTPLDGWANLCYTQDGSALGAGCATSGSMTCIPVSNASGAVARMRQLYLDSTWTINAKVCKSILTPQTNSQTVTIAPWARTLPWDGSDQFLGHEDTENFNCTNGDGWGTGCGSNWVRATWDATYLYLSVQGCGLNSDTGTVGNYVHAYIGSPSLIGTNYQDPAFAEAGSSTMTVFPTTGGDPNASVLGGARWHVRYDVETHAVELRQYNFSNGNWNDVVANAGVEAQYGNGNGTWGNCAAYNGSTGNWGDWIVVRVPWATLGDVRLFNVATATYLATPPPGVVDNFSAWPSADGAPFQTANSTWYFDRDSWRSPRGVDAPHCWGDGLDGSPTCQFPDPYETTPRRSTWANVAPPAPSYEYFVGPVLP